MKTILKILAVLIVLIVAALFLVPIIFKDDLVKLVKKEANNAVNAEIEFGDFDLSLIRSFPDLYFSIEDVIVSGVEDFENIDMASIGELDLVVDLMSVINGESIQVKSIRIDRPLIHLKVLADGTPNWDIAKVDTSATVDTATAEGSFQMDLQEVKILNGQFVYEDASLPMTMKFAGLNLDLLGDLSASHTNLDAKGTVDSANVVFDGVRYVSDAKVVLDAIVEMDLDSFRYTFRENTMRINELPLAFNGWLAMPEEAIEMDISFAAQETDFKELLSMIPAEFSKDLEGVKTEGIFQMDGMVKGTYIDSTYPAFAFTIQVDDAMFQYPHLPKSVNDINILAKINNPDGDLDKTVIDVNTFHFNMAGNPFDLDFYLATPISDPFIKADAKGTIVLDNIKDVVPLSEGDELSGTIKSDLALEGNKKNSTSNSKQMACWR